MGLFSGVKWKMWEECYNGRTVLIQFLFLELLGFQGFL